MKVCVVGNGPSARGRGEEIDACDFVVRLKAFWIHGAADAGSNIDAWAWYGDDLDFGHVTPTQTDCREHWFTQCPKQTLRQDSQTREARQQAVLKYSAGHRRQSLADGQWSEIRAFTGKYPSTGMVAVFMAIERFPDCNLHLYGFDATTRDEPGFCDARKPDAHPKDSHGQLGEKLSFRRIATEGKWMNKPTNVTLTWPDMPRMD